LIIKTEAKKFLSNYELFGLAIASFVHDIDHPGHTNFFEINLQSHLALRYNDKSVLENHHCSLTFFILHSKNIQLLRNLDEKDFATVRETIIECVLSTDMKFHMDLVKNLENKFMVGYESKYESKWDWESKSDRLLFAKIIIHTSDISNQVRPFEVSITGSLALRREFLSQIKKEQKLNLPSLEYMKMSDIKTFYSSEHFFSVNTVKPIWNVLVKMFPNLTQYKEHLEINIIRWEELLNGVGDGIEK
jgi:3',5'-cyclic-nucleotide phosphodiesterase